MNRYVLAIDIGTTNLKILAIADRPVRLSEGRSCVFARVSVSLKTLHPTDDSAEQNPLEIWQKVTRAVRVFLKKNSQLGPLLLLVISRSAAQDSRPRPTQPPTRVQPRTTRPRAVPQTAQMVLSSSH